MKIKNIKISELTPYSRNNKTHSQEQIKLVAKSIQEFGFVQPVVVDKNNNLIIGHCRLDSAKTLELKEVPCYVAEDLSEAQIKALRIADNKLNELGEWDDENLNLELQELADMDFDLGALNDFENIQAFQGDIDDFFREETDKETEKRIENTKCPHCGGILNEK